HGSRNACNSFGRCESGRENGELCSAPFAIRGCAVVRRMADDQSTITEGKNSWTHSRDSGRTHERSELWVLYARRGPLRAAPRGVIPDILQKSGVKHHSSKTFRRIVPTSRRFANIVVFLDRHLASVVRLSPCVHPHTVCSSGVAP